ncbi:MAG: glutathione S-transferase family protein [Proteobacteria bacterium]|nr:glutathione S-transferase family protein [Pseudomonadota bacterium]
MITIYNFPRGARGVRAFWVCEEMGVPYRAEAVSFPPSEAYRALNPMGTVPFLEDEGGVAINESTAMMLYIAERYGPTPLLPAKDDPALAKVLQFTVYGEGTLGSGMNPLMMAKFGAPDAEKDIWMTRALYGRMETALDIVAKALGDGPFIAGETFTLADISVSTAIDMWKGALGKDTPPALAAWRERVQSRPAYLRAAAAQQR